MNNEEKYKQITGLKSGGMNFYEIKSNQIRIGAFWQSGYKLYLTNTWIKKGAKAPANELTKIKKTYEGFIKL